MPMINNIAGTEPGAAAHCARDGRDSPRENIVPCFTAGTAIATPSGERPVEELRAGDRILTRDNGLQEIRWIDACRLDAATLRDAPELRPVRLRAGSLDHGLPDTDILVSPWHRILIQGDRTARFFEESEVLAAAGHLTGRDGIDVRDVDHVTYVHFMFDQHQVVLSNGFWTESFCPDDEVLRSLGTRQRNRILELFPDLVEPQGSTAYRAARRALSEQESRLLLD